MNKPKILFVCGRNKWRSPTAESIYKKDNRIAVRSVGLSPKSKRKLSNSDIEWADLILVMEQGYKSHILGRYRDLDLPPIENLDIPDEFKYNDQDLVQRIRAGTEYQIKHQFRL